MRCTAADHTMLKRVALHSASSAHCNVKFVESRFLVLAGKNINRICSPVQIRVIVPSRGAGQLTGFQFAALDDEEPLIGNTKAHEIALAIDCSRELVEDDSWCPSVHSLLAREPGPGCAAWCVILLNRQFVCSC